MAQGLQGVERPVRSYQFSSQDAEGRTHYDTLYIDHASRRVWDVQEGPQNGWKVSQPALELSRSHAARWLQIRRTVPNAILTSGRLFISRETRVPHLPVGPYADPEKIVLHESEPGSLQGYGYHSGEDAHGAAYTQTRLDIGAYDMSEVEENSDVCENCAQCDAELFDGDLVWLCLDGGDFYCTDHIIYDLRPDSLFKRVGAIRGEELPPFAWPGGYFIAYHTRSGSDPICADCASDPSLYDFDSDPITGADIDEEQNCLCGHARSAHSWLVPESKSDEHPYGRLVEDGECKPESTYGDEEHCDCPAYVIPTCEACGRPLDPADRKDENQMTAISYANFTAILAKNRIARGIRDGDLTRADWLIADLEAIETVIGTANQPTVREILESAQDI